MHSTHLSRRQTVTAHHERVKPRLGTAATQIQKQTLYDRHRGLQKAVPAEMTAGPEQGVRVVAVVQRRLSGHPRTEESREGPRGLFSPTARTCSNRVVSRGGSHRSI